MTNPKTGWMTREWEIETIVSKAYANASGLTAVGLFSSAKHPVVSEAVLLNAQSVGLGGTVTTIVGGGGTVIAHDLSFPTLGTVGGTQVATVGPQQFLVAGLSGTQTTGQFAIRGR